MSAVKMTLSAAGPQNSKTMDSDALAHSVPRGGKYSKCQSLGFKQKVFNPSPKTLYFHSVKGF